MKYTTITRGINKTSFMLLAYDIVAINLVYFIALWLRFDCIFSSIPERYLNGAIAIAPLYTIVTIVALAVLRLYQSIWRYALWRSLAKQFKYKRSS